MCEQDAPPTQRDGADALAVLRRHLHDPRSSFSIGSFGALAEFHRRVDEPLTVDAADGLTVATDRGAIRIEPDADAVPLAYETLGRRAGSWQHGVVFCLPRQRAAGPAREVLTEIGPDRDAIRPPDRSAVLFDMGLGAVNVEFCIRTADPDLLMVLRGAVGRSVLEAGNRVMTAIVHASPHRVAISALGRAEVYQPIGRDRTPEGPHTHVLPKLLRSGRTHAANIPVPRGLVPCLSLYPPHPLFDGYGERRSFNAADLAAFDALVARWGLPAYREHKGRVRLAVQRGADPEQLEPPRGRAARTALRVALRQMGAGGQHPETVRRWRLRYDAVAGASGQGPIGGTEQP
jgi:hypothetical protein